MILHLLYELFILSSVVLAQPTKDLCYKKTGEMKVIRPMIVFGSDDDGSRATGEWVNAPNHPDKKIAHPKYPWLRDAAGNNLILLMIKKTNRILSNSGAKFRIDEQNINYDLIADSKANTANDGKYIENLFLGKMLPYKDVKRKYSGRMILFFGWGPDLNVPRGGGASDVNTWFVNMPSRIDGGTKYEGNPVPGYYMLAHEMGHFLGLQHPFAQWESGMLDALSKGWSDLTITPPAPGTCCYKYNFANRITSPKGIHLNAASEADRDTAMDFIGTTTSFNALDSDRNGFSRKLFVPKYIDEASPGTIIYDIPGIQDTPNDLGVGFSAVIANKHPCSKIDNISLGKFSNLSNKVNRTNPMSYGICPTEMLSFSREQVALMERVLTLPHKKYFVDKKVIEYEECAAQGPYNQ